MQRCVALSATSLALFAVLAGPAASQTHRTFPANALRGEMAVAMPPEMLLEGRPARLAPGARIRGEDNLMTTSATLASRRLLVHYTVDLSGLVSEVWVLNAVERGREPWPRTPQQAASWRFDPQAQIWARP